MDKTIPNYRHIYADIINKRFPDKKEKCTSILYKESLSALDIIRLNNKIFGAKEYQNHRLRSYSKNDVLKILNYQKKNNLNNSELANHFRLSRNTVTKWKRMFVV